MATPRDQSLVLRSSAPLFLSTQFFFSVTDAKRSDRDSHVPILAPLPIRFAVFWVHLAAIPITGTGMNPVRSLGAAIIYNKKHAWDDHQSQLASSWSASTRTSSSLTSTARRSTTSRMSRTPWTASTPSGRRSRPSTERRCSAGF
ncbi:hypothetical protein L3X38_002754 [Prunus dulcis]|uniref:Uncharacterized protein n=1 Tax=Prunus dulcis TaxID=3755 RepID=A0AAD4WUL4_PRUDU|nr:hypothetical protein L3X38_002754 [Prunus dulcis]